MRLTGEAMPHLFPSAGRFLSSTTLACALAAGSGLTEARTMQVCPGPQNVQPPPPCFQVDTSVIDGRASTTTS